MATPHHERMPSVDTAWLRMDSPLNSMMIVGVSATETPIWPADFRRPAGRGAAPDKITVRHVLVKHAAAKNPREGVTRTRGEACLRAAERGDKILGGMSFDDAVGAFSDEPGAATRAGSIGEVSRDQLDPAFAATAFDLERGQMSDVVESPSGFHLILRAE